MIAPCFEQVLLQTVDLFHGEQSGSMVELWENCGKTVPIFHKQTEVGDRLTAELSGQRTEGRPQAHQTLFAFYICDSIALHFKPFKRMYENGLKIALNSTCSTGFK